MRSDNIVDTTDSAVAEKKVKSCVTCTLLHVLRDQLSSVAKCQNNIDFTLSRFLASR